MTSSTPIACAAFLRSSSNDATGICLRTASPKETAAYRLIFWSTAIGQRRLNLQLPPVAASLKEMTELRRKELDRAVWVDPQRMSGAPCFRNTRVPVQSLIDLLEGGESIDDFLALYPAIKREQIIAVLDFANDQLIECASSLTNA